MAATSGVKLFKIASELNMGRDAIVDFLQSKGFDIQNKPTSSLTEDMVEIVYEKFKREKIVAEKQREKLEKHHILRNAPGTEHKAEKDSEIVPTEEKVKETIIHEVEEKPKEEKVKPIKEKEPIISEKVVIPAPEVPEKVTSEKIETKQEEKLKVEDKNFKKKEIEESKPEIKEIPKVPVKEPVVEEIKEIIIKEEKKQEPKKVEQVEEEVFVEIEASETKEIIAHDDFSASSQNRFKYEQKENEGKKEITTETKSAEKEPEQRKDTGERHKKKRQKIIDVAPGQTPKLRGLTIVGKIELRKSKGDKSQSEGDRNKFRRDRDSSDKSSFRKGDRPGDQNRPRYNNDRPYDPNRPKFTGDRPPRTVTPTAPEPVSAAKDKELKFKKTITVDDAVKAPVKFKFKDKVKSKEEKQVKKHKKAIREQISDADVEKAVKETMAGIDGQHVSASRSKIKMKRKMEREEKAAIRLREDEERANYLELTEFVTTSDLARMMDVNPNQIIMKCISLGLMVTINQRLDKDTILLIAEDFGFQVEFIDEQAALDIVEIEDTEESLLQRAPIVTIMGHVDHGKTSLLDYIRRSNVVAGEAGGITQHIGAYQVELEGGRMITFLDTPGHAAFTAMRARGAQVTDIVVLVVAADDSVMPQTVEAISHAKAAGVPIVVAINKVDKPDSNPDRIKQQLADYDVLVEDWGGKHQSVEISAKFGQNVESLLEKILVEAELLDLKANPDRAASGTVIEAVMKKGFGPVATIIVQKGTLKVGDSFVAGVANGKVRTLLDEREKKVDLAGPSDPVIVVGFDTLPEAGDTFIVTANEIEARNISQERSKLKREQELRQIRKISLDDISQKIQQGNVKELKLILKGDVSGSVEALSDSLAKLSQDEVRVQIIHKGVGTILETDVILASASEAVIVGFNVSVDNNARKLADVEKVDIRLYNIIYDCINEINLALEGLLSPEYQEETTAVIEVRQTFKISRIGTIAGCYVQNGKISRTDKVKVLRDGLLVHSGNITSLKREKDDVKEVDAGYECGIMISNFNDFELGDTIESYKVNEIKRKLR